LLFLAGALVLFGGQDRIAEPLSGVAQGLHPLLVDSRGDPIQTLDQWRKRRGELKREWQMVLGAFPKTKHPLNLIRLDREVRPGYMREHLKYQVEEGLFVDGYLLMPAKPEGRLPAVVVFHPTTPLQAKGVAGLAPEYPEEKWQGVQLVERGYVVWCPRNYINTDGADWSGNAAKVIAAHPGWTGMARMTWDAIRAADFLESLPNVDPKRIGCLGHSLGAKQVLYGMAFDERYRAGVSSEGGIGLKFSNWDAVWYLGPKVRAADFSREHHELLAMIAPRAFLLMGGGSADGEASREFVRAVEPVYRLLGGEGKIQLMNHKLGHAYPPEARKAAEAFLERELGSQSGQ
jgi:hypothetical protein